MSEQNKESGFPRVERAKAWEAKVMVEGIGCIARSAFLKTFDTREEAKQALIEFFEEQYALKICALGDKQEIDYSKFIEEITPPLHKIKRERESVRVLARALLTETQEAQHSLLHYYHYGKQPDYDDATARLNTLEKELERLAGEGKEAIEK